MAIPGYKILRKIRQGGMSTVYLAIQKSVDREVAIKVMSPKLSVDPSFGSRFYREAKIVGQLSHPNIVSIYDVGSYKHYNYIAMDYLPGAPLQDRLDEGVTNEEATQIIKEMASALDYAHKRGYIHRDIKPDNILFREDGSAVLCDFGIAKALKGNIKMTNVGAVLGTPHYMSPEQAQGKSLDGRADIYSLGAVFFEMLSGHVPFTGDDAVAVAVNHMTSPLPKLLSEHRAFQPIIEKMMAKKSSNRYQTGKEVIEALEELERSLANNSVKNVTTTRSATVHLIGLAGALFSTLASAIKLSVQRLLLTRINFSPNTPQLSRKHLDDIDKFILSEDVLEDVIEGDTSDYDDMALFQDTVEQSVIGYSKRRIYIPLAILTAVVLAFVYMDEQHPETLRDAYVEISQPNNSNTLVTKNIPTAETLTPDTPSNANTTNVITVNKEQSELTAKSSEKQAEKPQEYALTIDTNPPGAAIRILNIKPRYTQGMLLAEGNYHIEISAKGYIAKTFWLRIKDAAVKRTITLLNERKQYAAGTIFNDQLADGSEGPKMVVLPQAEVTTASQQILKNDYPLAISQYEITFDDYQKFVVLTNRSEPQDFGWGKKRRPVIDVSYHDAKAYAEWLSQETGYPYRLPSKEEWQFAAAGGSSNNHWWGNSSADGKANCRRGCRSKYSRVFGSTTAPVGSYEANAYGVYDSAGNVAEWLAECQQKNGNTCIKAAVAGGSHSDTEKNIQPDAIKVVEADKGDKTIGFRLVIDL